MEKSYAAPRPKHRQRSRRVEPVMDNSRRAMKTFTLRFVPHLQPVTFEVKGRNLESAVRKAEAQIKKGKGPIFEQVRERLYEELLNAVMNTKGNPSLAPCPCRNGLSRIVEQKVSTSVIKHRPFAFFLRVKL